MQVGSRVKRDPFSLVDATVLFTWQQVNRRGSVTEIKERGRFNAPIVTIRWDDEGESTGFVYLYEEVG